MVSVECFIREYVKAIREGNAAVFAGAGLSRASGFVTWKELLRPMAEDIGLNIDDETDLTLVAQYIRNEDGNRGNINDKLIESFTRDSQLNDNVEIITRMPISTYWTTNYDQLIEEGLEKASRKAAIKKSSSQLSSTNCGVDAVVYKMHGDAEFPSEAVLTKDDYDQYKKTHPFFRNLLMADLLSKTFLFIGFSFDDPNLNFVISELRLQLGENIKNHYCFMKRIQPNECKNNKDYEFKQIRENFHEEYLKKYGIRIVWLNDFSQITNILTKVERAVLKNNVFISGSISHFDKNWPETRVNELAYKLSNSLVKENFRVTSGYGLGIGSAVITGALDEIYKSKYKHLDANLCLRPFPQCIADEFECKNKWTQYRKDMINDTGIAIFMFGNKIIETSGKKETVEADGCLEEFEIAKSNNNIIIPIGSTGYVAKKIFNEVKAKLSDYLYLKDYIDILESDTDIDNLVKTVTKIAKELRG